MAMAAASCTPSNPTVQPSDCTFSFSWKGPTTQGNLVARKVTCISEGLDEWEETTVTVPRLNQNDDRPQSLPIGTFNLQTRCRYYRSVTLEQF